MSAASDKDLGTLHSVVARVLKDQLEGEPTAAVLGAAITFLKNNNITATSENEELSALKDELAKKRASGRDALRDMRAAADDFADRLGGPMQ
jgi:hypothetical protein